MSCEAARERLLDRAYGELAPAEARAVEEHLAGCAACQAEAARIEEARGLYRRLGEEAPPGGEGILMAAAREAARAREPRLRLFAWPRVAIGLAVAIVVGGVSVKLLSERRSPPAEEALLAREEAPLAKEEERAPPARLEGPAAPPTAAEPERKAAPDANAARLRARSPALGPGRAEKRADEPRLAEGADARAAPAAGLAAPERPLAAGESAPPAAQSTAEGPVAAAGRAPAPAALEPSAGDAPPAKAPAGAAGRLLAAPRQAEEYRARREAAREASGAAGAEPFAEGLLRELRRRRDAGELNEARREPDPCPGGDVRRVAWFDGAGKAWRLARTGPLPAGMGDGEATRDQYYDGAGRLRVAVIDGAGPSGRFRRRIVLDEAGRRLLEDPPGSPWPGGDLTLRDAAAAFWAPQRCAAGVR